MREPFILPEMLAAGIEAKRAAEEAKLEEGYVVQEIYLAMYGTAMKAAHERVETVQ